MLFDLRSRRRKNTVRVVYSLLAAVMVIGLVVFGIGTGGAGLLGGNNDVSSSSGPGASGLIRSAQAAVKKDPSSATAWGNLFYARYTDATTGSNVTGTENQLTKGGVAAMKAAAPAWQRYLAVSAQKPSLVNATNAAKMYVDLGLYGTSSGWGDAVSAWEYVIQALPPKSYSSLVNQYQCLAFSAYAGGQTAVGDRAAAKTLQVSKAANLPKADITGTASAFKTLKSSPKDAENYAASSCSTLSVG